MALLLQVITLVISPSKSQKDACISIYNMSSTPLVVNPKTIAAVAKYLIHVDMRTCVTFKPREPTVMVQEAAWHVLPGLNSSE